MSNHSIAETKDRLSELVGRAEKGEEIVITRHGRPVAKISAVVPERKPKPITQEDIDWLDKHRVGKIMPSENSVETIRRLRDGDYPG